MFSKLALAAAVALPLGMLGLSGTAFADYNTHYYIPVKPIPSAQKPAATPVVHHAGMSCSAAERMIRHDGYSHVKARDCVGKNYTFHAMRNGHAVVLHVNSENGQLRRA